MTFIRGRAPVCTHDISSTAQTPIAAQVTGARSPWAISRSFFVCALLLVASLFYAPIASANSDSSDGCPPGQLMGKTGCVPDLGTVTVTGSGITVVTSSNWPASGGLYIDWGSMFPTISGLSLEGGSGDLFSGNPGMPGENSQIKCGIGNPIIPSTGNKVEPETDFVSTGEMPLVLERTYDRYWTHKGIFGWNWISNFDLSLLRVDQEQALYAYRNDGRTVIYQYKTAPTPAWYELKADPVSKIVEDGAGGYILYTDDDGVETYNAAGQITSLKNVAGVGITFSYSNGHLFRATHSSGRYVEFRWSGDLLTTVIDPAGNAYQYGYKLSQNPGDPVIAYLETATQPGTPSTTITYHYELNNGALTGKSYNGQRYSTVTYNDLSYATSSVHAGGVDKNTFAYSTDVDFNWVVKHTNPLGKVTTYVYGQGKKLKSVTGEPSSQCPGVYRELTYDANGYQDLVTDFEGGITDYDYNDKGQLLKKTEAAGTSSARVTQYVWDASKNRVVSETIVGLRKTEYAYLPSHRVGTITVTNLSTNGVSEQRRTTAYSYTSHPNGMLATKTVDGPLPGSGDATTETYDALGNLISIQNSLGHTVTYSNFSGLGMPQRVTGINGAVVDYSYDARGRVLEMKNWVSGTAYTTTNTYDNRGHVTKTIAADGVATNLEYDVVGRLTKIYRNEPDYVPEATSSGAATSVSMAAEAEFQPDQCFECEPQDPPPPPPPSSTIRGNIDGIANDALVGWACSSGINTPIPVHMYLGGAAGSGVFAGEYQANQPSEPAVAAACSASGTTYRFSIPLTTSLRQQYAGWPIYIHGISPVGGSNLLINASGNYQVPAVPPPPPAPLPPVGFQKFTYNLNSQVTKTEIGVEYTPVGSTTRQTVILQSQYVDYDELGRVRGVRGNNGQNVRYTYDNNDNIKTIVDSLNRTTTLTYDALDRLVKSVDAKNGITEFKYDAGDQLVWVKDPRGLATTYSYDGFGQLWSQTSPDTGTTTFQYNAAGLRSAMTRNDGSWLSYGYDDLGRLTWYGNSSTNGRGYSYDSCTNGKGKLCSFSSAPDGSWTSLHYTQQGQVATRYDSTAGAGDLTSYAYDGMGRLTGITYPSGVNVGYGYSSGKLTSLTATVNGQISTVLDRAYYQPFGAVSGWTYGNGLARRYSHDLDGRLTGISVGDDTTTVVQSLGFGWNAGNEITRITNGINAYQTYNFGYDALSRLTSANTAVIGYDAVGNRTEFNAQTYGIDPASNRLQYTTDPSSTRYFNTNANGNIYAYTGADGAYNGLTYDAFNRVATHTRGGVATNYAYNAMDQRVSKAGSARFVYGGTGQLLAENKAGLWSNYVWLGSELVGVVRNNELYYVHSDQVARPEVVTNGAKAVVWQANNTPFNRGVSTDTFGGLNLGFPGQYWDVESGLWHNGYRSYEPTLGRYIQSDPIGLRGGINTYAYVEGNPITNVDPLGLESWQYSNGLTPNNNGLSKCEQAAVIDFGINQTPFLSWLELGVNVISGGSLNPLNDGDQRDEAIVSTAASAAASGVATYHDLGVHPADARYQDWLSRPNSGLSSRHRAAIGRQLERSAVQRSSAAIARKIAGPGMAFAGYMYDASKCGCASKK